MHSAGKTNGDGDDSDDGADKIGKKMRWSRQRSIHRLLRSNNTQGG